MAVVSGLNLASRSARSSAHEDSTAKLLQRNRGAHLASDLWTLPSAGAAKVSSPRIALDQPRGPFGAVGAIGDSSSVRRPRPRPTRWQRPATTSTRERPLARGRPCSESRPRRYAQPGGRQRQRRGESGGHGCPERASGDGARATPMLMSARDRGHPALRHTLQASVTACTRELHANYERPARVRSAGVRPLTRHPGLRP